MASPFLLLSPSPTMSLVFTTNSRPDDHPRPRHRCSRPSDARISKSLCSCGRSRGMCMQWRWFDRFSNMQFCSGRFGPLGEPLSTNSGVLHYVSGLGVKCLVRAFGGISPTKSGVLHYVSSLGSEKVWVASWVFVALRNHGILGLSLH